MLKKKRQPLFNGLYCNSLQSNKFKGLPMTKYNLRTDMFQRVNGRKFAVNFDGGNISSNGGLLLLAELDKKLKITSSVSRNLESF
jgi:hypothetical protein